MKVTSLVIGLCSLCLLSGAFAAEAPRTVSVSGSCIRSVIPDRGAVTLTAESRDSDAKRAQAQASRTYEGARSKALGLKLPDAEISTSEYTSEEVKEWEKDRMVSRGFRTRIGLRVVTSDTARLGEVLEMASREGIKQVGGMQLFVSSKKLLDEKMVCLKEAAEQARAKADTLAKSLAAKVGEAIAIQESPSYSPGPMPMLQGAMAMGAMEERAPPPRIEPGKIEVSTSVNVTFGLK